MKIHQTELEVVRASALDIEADAIVNAANTGMRGGGGIDGAIHYRAGYAMKQELQQVAPYGAETAEVVVTAGHALPHQFIFHVAGPIWSARHEAECEEQLTLAYQHALEEADARQLTTIVIPSISTGVYAFPLQSAAPIALLTAIQFLERHPETSLRRVTFAMWGGEEHHVFRRALESLERSA
ncbi:RNase III inhibitor [bacterium]|nr:MAG: RNase III inhibitor [bacterium]